MVGNLHTFFLFPFSNWGYIENCEIWKKIQKWRKFEVRANFFVISVTGSKVCYLDSQCSFLHFELLIDVLARKLTELWRFQNLTYFLTSWPSYLTYIFVQRTCRNHGLVLACDQIWWRLTESFLRFCEISVQTNKQTNRKIKFWQVTNTTNEHTCQNQILASNKHDQPTYLPKWLFWQVMKGQSDIAYLPKFAYIMPIVMVIVITEIL